MRITYFADIRFPLERANGIQTMETCAALTERGHVVELVVRPDTRAPARNPFDYYGIAPLGQPRPQEYRADMTLAQGKDGFSVPSLYGLALGAPFFHAGNARTLEEVFDDGFATHHRNAAIAVPSDFLNAPAELHYLIEFLLSLDENTATEDIPPEMDFCSHRLP